MIAPYKIVVKSDAAAPGAIATLTDLKNYLRVRSALTDDDNLINRLEKSARHYIESRARVVLTPTVFVYTAPEPTIMENGEWMVFFPKTPVRSIDTVKIRNSAGSQTTLAAGVGYADWSAPPTPAIRLIDRTPTPWNANQPDFVEVVFTAGFDAESTGRFPLPDQLRTAALSLVAFWYENRGSGMVPTWIDLLIDSACSGL